MAKGELMQVDEERLNFLDELRESGITNMYGAAPFLQGQFPGLDRKEAERILAHWMDTADQRRKERDSSGD